MAFSQNAGFGSLAADRTEPIEFNSDRLIFNQGENLAELFDEVEANKRIRAQFISLKIQGIRKVIFGPRNLSDTDRKIPANDSEQEDLYKYLLRLATYASVIVATILIFIKIHGWIETDSVSLLSSLLDSVLDAGASILNLIAVRHALVPADKEHRFGHGKAEALAGLVQAAFIKSQRKKLGFCSFHQMLAMSTSMNRIHIYKLKLKSL